MRIGELYPELRRRNAHVSGEGAGGGLLFDNMMEHFVFCTDEACLFGHHKERCFLEGGKGFKLEAFSNDVSRSYASVGFDVCKTYSTFVFNHRFIDLPGGTVPTS